MRPRRGNARLSTGFGGACPHTNRNPRVALRGNPFSAERWRILLRSFRGEQYGPKSEGEGHPNAQCEPFLFCVARSWRKLQT